MAKKGLEYDQPCAIFNTWGTDCFTLVSNPWTKPFWCQLFCSQKKWRLVTQLETAPQHLQCTHCMSAHCTSNWTAEKGKEKVILNQTFEKMSPQEKDNWKKKSTLYPSLTWFSYLYMTYILRSMYILTLEKYLYIDCFVFKENSTIMAKLHKMCNKNIIVNSVNICWKSNNKILLLYTSIEHFSPREIYNFTLLYQQTFWNGLLLSRLKLDA